MRMTILSSIATLLRLGRCESGLALIEFAVSTPVILSLAMAGTEIANMTTTNLKVSELAVSVADNASRLGQTDNTGVSPSVTEGDVDSIMYGALRQGGTIDFENKGRVILTSLERDTATGNQYIHWQRCRGNLDRDSRYGDAGTHNGLNGDQCATHHPRG